MTKRKLSLQSVTRVPMEWVPQLPSRVFDNMTKNMLQVVDAKGVSYRHSQHVDLRVAIKWCEEHCEKRWALHEINKIFYFESRVDATMFVTTNPDIFYKI